MRKKFLIFSIVCLLFCTLSYTYSSFKNTIVGNISGNIKDWVFKVSIDNSTKYEDGYKLHLTGTSGSFNVNINTVGGASGADYSIELIGDSSIKYYTDSSYTNLIDNNIYKGSINSNTSGNVTIYYKSSSNIDDDIYVKTKGSIMEIAMMKNGYGSWPSENGGTEFWNNTYKPYIRTIEFGNDLSNLPSDCAEENLCWDISYSASQKKKVYGYLTDSGYKDSTDTTKTLYNLYIVSETSIFAPNDGNGMFGKFENLTQIDFNNNFNTSKVTDMTSMFYGCSSLTNLNLSSFNTSNVTNMSGVFSSCSSLKNLDLSNFNTSKVTYMDNMFRYCSSLTSLNLNKFDTSKVTDMSDMFDHCSSLTNLNLSSFDTSNVTDMWNLFQSCSSLKSLDLSNFNTSKVTNMTSMFDGCSSLTNLNLSSFNTSKVTSMKDMFNYCRQLTSLDLSSFNTLNVTDVGEMFYSCFSLTSLNLSSFNTSKVTNMYRMFFHCSSLTNLDLSNFNTSKVTNMSYMFDGCSSLVSLDLSSFDTSNVVNMSYMFRSCTKLTTTINIMNVNISTYSAMFSYAATSNDASITVNYISSASSLVDSMIATKSSNSNVVKGSQI